MPSPISVTRWPRRALLVRPSRGAEISVRVTRRDDRKLGRPARTPRCAVADAFPALNIANLDDAGFEFDDGEHRIVGFRRWIDAVQRSTWPCQIELELPAEKDA